MAPQSEMASIPNVNTYSGCGRNWFSMKSICAVICMSFSFFSFFALGWLVWCNCTTRWKPSVQLCAQSVRRFHSEYFMPQACNLFCLPYCYISPQWWQAGLWSAITLKNNRIKGQPSPSLSRTMQYRSETSPAPPAPLLIGWNICLTCHFWHVIYCWQQQRGSLMINLLWDRACFMGFTSLPLNYAWVFPQHWGWM